MAFTPEPMLPGDLHEGAARLARAASEELVRLPTPLARAAALERWWGEAASLGWPLLAVPEAGGGAGGSLEDLAALVEGAASDALPLPLVEVCGVLPALLAAVPAGRATAALAGEARLCPVLDGCGWDGGGASPSALRDAAGALRLSGTARGVPVLPAPTGFLLACPVDGEAGLVLVPATALRQPLRRFERLDGRLSADLALDGVALPAEALLARGPEVAARMVAARELGACLTCVEVVAALGSAIERVIAYLSERRQFGAPLSSLQALRHKVAETFVTFETLRALTLRVLRTLAADGGAFEAAGADARKAAGGSREVALLKLHVGREARRAAETIIQLHGGMGMTEELPATRLNKRLLMAEFEYGDAALHARRLLRAA